MGKPTPQQMTPYFIMALLFAGLAALTALDAALTGFGLLPWFNGLRWLRVHFITLGLVTEFAFGLLPVLAAVYARQPMPKTRLDIWLALNSGLIILIVGVPLMNSVLMITGGTLVFIAALLLFKQLSAFGLVRSVADKPAGVGRKFYLSGLSFLLLGIFIGAGLWVGWPQLLGMRVPIEVHIHANIWGFMALVFAGLLVDLYPGFAGRQPAWSRSITPIFWMMTTGALFLVLGPWLSNQILTVVGIVLHLGATGWLLLGVYIPLRGDELTKTPGLWHLFLAYLWIIAPVLVAPLIILQVPGFPGVGVEQSAPQALIYGWVLQFSFAVIPYLFSRVFLPNQPAKLGGSWLTLSLVNLGAVLLWASILITNYQPWLFGTAYALWALSMLPIIAQIYRSVRAGVAFVESAPAFLDDAPVASPNAS